MTIALANAKKVTFEVKGKRSSYKNNKKETITPKYSAYVTKTWEPAKPNKPTVTYDYETTNRGTFNVKYTADTKEKKVALNVQWQTCISKNDTNPPKTGWSAIASQSGLTNMDRDFPYEEQTEDITKTGVVRWFRARTTGNGGTTDWVYSRHAYSTPFVPALASASAKKVSSKSNTTLTAKWTTKESLSHPVEEETLQYLIAPPETYACTPPNGTWKDAISVNPSGKEDTVTAYVSDMTTLDDCMWVRVKATHDTLENYSTAKRVITEKLAKPGISATVDFTTGWVDVTITSNSRSPVARHCVFWRNPKKPNVNIPVLILGHSTTTGRVQIPGLVNASKSCIGVFDFVGTNNDLSINAVMKSDEATDSDINVVEPDAPGLSQYNDNSVNVDFTWKWSGATSLDISYSDLSYAWESNKQPTVYNMTRTGARRWVITDLEVGKVWYFRLKYHGIEDGEEIESDWGPIASIDLATTPETPAYFFISDFILFFFSFK